MSEAGIGPNAARLLARSIESVMEVEVLLYLHRQRGQAFDAPSVARSLYLDPIGAGTILAELANRGLVQASGSPLTYCVDPLNAELKRSLDELERDYTQRRVAVINAIFNRPAETQDPIRRFSDAFRLKGDR